MKVKEIIESFIDEKDFQHYFVERLVEDNGYVKRSPRKYDAGRAMDPEMLIGFLESTQPEAMAALAKKFGRERDEAIVNKVNARLCAKDGGLLQVLKGTIEIGGQQLVVMGKPQASNLNRKAVVLCEKNVFSAMEEVVAGLNPLTGRNQRIDVVVFLNGIALASFELKCGVKGQTVKHAMKQYCDDRDPKNRLFLFQAGCLVNFAMDLDQVYMTTKLDRGETLFLPFNRGKGRDDKCGAGNPTSETEFSTGYMWTDIFRKDTLVDLITRYCFLEIKEAKKVKGKVIPEKRTIIFPRYHQLDCVRRVLADVKQSGTESNYLIKHSAGSGKTNTIAWLAYRLASLHDAADRPVLDKVIVMTDRVVVDRQLQKALFQINHQEGQIELIGEKKTSADLEKAIKGKTKIIATTIQKFPVIYRKVRNYEGLRFGVLIDEAHSSTSGQDMAAVTKTLGIKDGKPMTPDELLDAELKGLGKQKNVTMFAFTATPKDKTLALFGTERADGKRHPFHTYSMKQAIEEGFIHDVLSNYVEYESFYTIIKKVADDPKYKTRKAAAKIARFAMLHPTMIAQRVEIIVEHFREAVMATSDFAAKAMVVTASREEAVRYSRAIDEYIKRNGYGDMRTLVAFSGSKKIDGKEVSEVGLNKLKDKDITEANLADIFDAQNDFRVLIVADKYQTGFDQKKLCAMYVLKKLSGIAAVQTLSRLNRACPGKKTFVLDFVNSVEDMEKAFAPYYEMTFLSNDVTPEKVYRRCAEIEAYGFLSKDDIDEAWNFMCLAEPPKKKIAALYKTAVDAFGEMDEKDQVDALRKMRQFVKAYDFIVQATFLNDGDLHKKRIFIGLLIPMVSPGEPPSVIHLKDKIDAVGIGQRKVKETLESKIVSKPEIKFIEATGVGQDDDLERKLSEIIELFNSKSGKGGGKGKDAVTMKGLMQIYESCKQSKALKKASRANRKPEEFALPFNNQLGKIISGAYDDYAELVTMLQTDAEFKLQFSEAIMGSVLDSFLNEK